MTRLASISASPNTGTNAQLAKHTHSEESEKCPKRLSLKSLLWLWGTKKGSMGKVALWPGLTTEGNHRWKKTWTRGSERDS